MVAPVFSEVTAEAGRTFFLVVFLAAEGFLTADFFLAAVFFAALGFLAIVFLTGDFFCSARGGGKEGGPPEGGGSPLHASDGGCTRVARRPGWGARIGLHHHRRCTRRGRASGAPRDGQVRTLASGESLKEALTLMNMPLETPNLSAFLSARSFCGAGVARQRARRVRAARSGCVTIPWPPGSWPPCTS